MMQPLKDAFYLRIIAALAGSLDPQVFERCMGDLLRPDFPSLVPVPGGSDSGFDGAIADGQGEPFPLVCTTDENVIGNLTRSLERVLESGWRPRRVALATSRVLTTQRRENLFHRAREKGFELMQVFDQSAIADRLYNHSRWRKELLGISGRPAALSMVPPTRRPLIDLEPVGQEADLRWLRDSRGDRVLAGEPGSGKSFLLNHAMRSGWPALFLASPDFNEEAIADAYRDLKPEIMVVDDAHADPDLLEQLTRLRRRMDAGFEILATTWKGARDEVMAALGQISESQVRTLELLTRDEIVEVLRRVGVPVDENPELTRILVNQAANKPGLAVTIASLALQGWWREILEGTALSRTLVTFFERYVGRESTQVLAALSLGGDRGMSLEAVRDYLGLNRAQISQITKGLASGGVLAEVNGGEALAVWPRELRAPLLRSVFFPDDGPRLDYRDLLERVPSRGSTAETLVAAGAQGMQIPLEELRALVAQSGSRTAWQWLAELSEQDARWALEHYPGDIVEIARGALERAAEPAIVRLLERAESATGPPHPQPDHPMRLLEDWVRELEIPDEETIRRRRQLARISKGYLQAGGRRSVGVHGLCLALSPALETSSLDPGLGRTVIIRWGLLPLRSLLQIEAIWDEIRDALGEKIDEADWKYLSEALWSWVYPDYASKSQEVEEEVQRAMHAFAAKFLRDLAPLAQGSPGVIARLKDLAAEIGIELDLERDPVFELLHPAADHDRDLRDLREPREAVYWASLKELAAQWVKRNPIEVVDTLVRYEQQARAVNRDWPRRAPALCREIATATEAPSAWIDAFLHREAPDDLVRPFLERVVQTRAQGWEEWIERTLDVDRYTWVAKELILELPSPPAHLFQRVLEKMTWSPQVIETLCLRRQVPLATLRALLRHPDWETALAAAVGEWCSDPPTVRDEVRDDWRAAILQARPREATETQWASGQYWLGDILAQNPDLAFEWLRARLRESDRPHRIRTKSPFTSAIAALDASRRVQLLDEAVNGQVPYGMLSLLVGKDPEVYRKALSLEALDNRRLQPLAGAGPPDEAWLELALAALEAGYEPRDVARASFGGDQTWWGSGAEHWRQWDEAFGRFEDDPREEVQDIAREGRRIARERMDEALAEERREAMRGI